MFSYCIFVRRNSLSGINFSRDLETLDRGNREEANRLFKKSIELDPAYKKQVDNVQGLN